MPTDLHNSLNSFELNSPPRSVLKQIMNAHISFSTLTLKFLNEIKTSDFSCRKYTQVFRVKSSMKLRKHLFPPCDAGLIGPHISECINCSYLVALHTLFFGIESLCCFPTKQVVHVSFAVSKCGNPTTIFF